MKAKLTKRERALRTIRFEEVDRIATYDILDNDGAIAHYAGEPVDPVNGARVKCKAIARCLDMTRMLGGPNAPGRQTDADGFVWQIEPWTSWIVERPFNDLESLVAWVKEKIVRLRQYQPGAAEARHFHEYLLRHQAYLGMGCERRGDLPVVVIESGVGVDAAYSRCGLELFSMLVCFEPELADEWIEEQNLAEIRRVRAIARPDLIPVALTYDDLASKNGPLFAPDWIRQHHIPRLKRLVEAWHARDTYCLYHSDGNLMPILDDLVSTGIDGLNPIETCAGMSIAEVRRRHPRLFMAGGIDVSQLLPHGTPRQIRARCLEAIAEADGVGYFLGSTTEIIPAVPAANVVAMLETPKVLARRARRNR
ncbi:MAG: hypothetical protein M1457_04985 [bacterium]|nr:hypothetical protein [bacterium]